MAKRKSKGGRTQAASLGKSLHQVKSRLDSWRKERDELAAQLRGVIATGERMLAELGGSTAARVRRAGGARTGKRRLSPEGRARIIAAAKKRWAQYRKEQGK